MKKLFLIPLLFFCCQVMAQSSGNLIYQVRQADTSAINKGSDSSIHGFSKGRGTGSVDMSTVLLGITDFAIERSKTELNIAFFKRFQDFLAKYPEAKTLFPGTLDQLKRIADFQFNEFLPKLRNTLFDDLNKFPDNISNVLILPKYRVLFARFPEIAVAVRSLTTISKLKTNTNELSLIINELASYSEYSGANSSTFLKNYGATLAVVNHLSQAFVDPDSESGAAYYRTEQIQEILDDPNKLNQIFARLQVLIADNKIEFCTKDGKCVKISDQLASININPVVFKSLMQNIANALTELEKSKTSLNQMMTSNASPLLTTKMKQDAFMQYLNTVSYSIDAMSAIFKTMDNVEAEAYLNLTRNLTQITRDAVGQNYTALASSSINFMTSVMQMAQAREPENDTIEADLEIASQLLKYANFAATIVEAQNAQEVKEAIESVALPPGSSSIKKNSSFNISLQMHLGMSATIKNWDNAFTVPSWKNNIGVTLPIGVSFNKGLGRAGSLGLFGAIIDLGALAQYRFSGDTSLKETIKLQNVFSPGVYLSYGLPWNLPLSLNLGGQYGPGLTKVSTANINVEKPSWRLLASLTVDIPAFTLFNRSTQKTKKSSAAKFGFK